MGRGEEAGEGRVLSDKHYVMSIRVTHDDGGSTAAACYMRHCNLHKFRNSSPLLSSSFLTHCSCSLERERERERKRVESGEYSEVILGCALLQSIRQPARFPHSSTPCCFVCVINCCCCCRLQLLLLARSFVFLESHVIFCS